MTESTDHTNGPRGSGSGPLAGMRVIELAHVMAGPICGMMLADMGADVIKVEKTNGGDDTRRTRPPEISGESAAFMMMNRNKRGMVIDLKHTEGRATLMHLLKDADVLIENYRHDTMEKLGLGYEVLKAHNPGLIYAEISGFGRTGPYHTRGGFDLIAQGMAGLMSITGPAVAEGQQAEPVKVGPPVSDITAGILAAMGVAAAFADKQRTGRGNRVDTSLFEAAITHTYWQSAIAFATGETPQPLGSAHPLNAPYQAVATKDGYINIGAANQGNWERLLGILEAPELGDDPRFKTNDQRMLNLGALIEALEVHFKTGTSAFWTDKLNDAGFPSGPILTIPQMHKDPQTLAREMVTRVEHPVAGSVETLGTPVKFHETPTEITRAAPLYGEHSREVLAEYGFKPEEIEQLIDSGAVKTSDQPA